MIEILTNEKKKKKTKKRGKKPSKSGKKAAASASSLGKTTSREHNPTPARYHHNKRRQPRENVALELIFLIAILYEGVALSDNDLLSVRGNAWNDPNRRSAAEIIELDD